MTDLTENFNGHAFIWIEDKLKENITKYLISFKRFFLKIIGFLRNSESQVFK